jgi:hypothetical protein
MNIEVLYIQMDLFMKNIDRRHAVRLKIEGAEVFYKLQSGQTSFKPLKDITKNSARFEVEHTLNQGTFVELELIIPGRENIPVKGNVIRISDPGMENTSYAVVLFVPFGTDERYNSMQCYEQLSNLVEERLLMVEVS